MKVVILCGGMGTRLREETEFRPKPLVMIGGRPILWHIMKLYAHYGFRQFVLCLGYKGEMIKDYFLDYDLRNRDFTVRLGSKDVEFHTDSHDEHDWEVTLVDTGLETMTGGRIRRIRRFVGDEDFMVTYGDGVADVDLNALVRLHRQTATSATLTGVRRIGRFGELTVHRDLVETFAEKPNAVDSWINGGFFVFKPRIFDLLADDSTVLEGPPLEKLAASGELAVYKHPGFWHCMDTQRDMDALNGMWGRGEAPWKIW